MEVSRGFWKKLCVDNAPCGRSGHSCVTFDSKMYIFGGHDGNDVLNDHYCLDLKTIKWTKLSGLSKLPNIPSARASHAASIDNLTGVVYIFGGTGKDFGSSNKRDMFLFSVFEGNWEDIKCQGTLPSARYGHSLTFYQGSLYLFGGTSGEKYFNDFFLYHIESKSWVQLSIKNPPGIRYKHSAKVLDNKLMIIGGTNYKETRYDIWEINLTNQESSQVRIEKSEISGKYTQAAEVFGGVVYILGASAEFNEKASLWKLDLLNAKWQEVSQYGHRPAKVGFFSMSIEEGFCIIFGGNDNNKRLNDTFVYRLEICMKERVRTFEYLIESVNLRTFYNNVEIVTNQDRLYINKEILEIRVPILGQKVNGLQLTLNYSTQVVQALLEYILSDKISPLKSISNLLQLFSISVIYWIPALSKVLSNMISRKISEYNVKEIINYITENSTNRLFHRQELEENMKNFSQSTLMNQIIMKHITETFDMSLGEKIYWLCIDTLVLYNIRSGLNDSILQDIRQVSSKNSGKSIPKRTNTREIDSDLLWSIRILYESDKDFTVNCTDGPIKVHRIVLVSNSIYFEQMVSVEDTFECTLECPTSHFIVFVDYFYFGLDRVKGESPSRLAELLPLADYLLIKNKDLHDFVGMMIKEDLDLDNVFETLELAFRLKSTIMLHVIYEYFMENYSKLVHKDEMLKLPVQVLVDLHRWRASKSNIDGSF